AVGVVAVGGIAAALAVSAATILTYYGVAHLAALRLRPDEGRPPRVVPAAGLLGCVLVVAGLVLAARTLG
ncbi:MAG: amino acid permease, partial [Candidatus Nanopelagicales bacterium]